MKTTFACLLLAATALAGCHATGSLKPAASPGVKVETSDAQTFLSSEKTHLVLVKLVSTQYSDNLETLPAVYICVVNRSSAPFEISSASVTATSGGSPVAVYTPELLARIVDRQAHMRARHTNAMAAVGAMNTSADATGRASEGGIANSNGSMAGSVHSQAALTFNNPDLSPAEARIDINRRLQIETIVELRNAQLAGFSSLLGTVTLPPDSMTSGIVKLHADQITIGKPLTLSVNAGSEVHEFVFDVSP